MAYGDCWQFDDGGNAHSESSLILNERNIEKKAIAWQLSEDKFRYNNFRYVHKTFLFLVENPRTYPNAFSIGQIICMRDDKNTETLFCKLKTIKWWGNPKNVRDYTSFVNEANDTHFAYVIKTKLIRKK